MHENWHKFWGQVTQTADPREPFYADVSDNVGLDRAELKLDGEFVLEMPLANTTAAFGYIPDEDLSCGPHEYELIVFDTSNRIAIEKRTFTVYAPGGPTKGEGPFISGPGLSLSGDGFNIRH